MRNSTSTVAIVSADFIGPVAPVVAKPKRASKPKADKPAKPEAAVVAPVAAKPAPKPVDPAIAKAAADRAKLLGNARTVAASVYNGPSLSIRASDRDIGSNAYVALFASPKHRTTLAKLTNRDDSAMLTILRNTKAGTFNPTAINLDRGNFSRLCSVGFIASNDDGTFKLTPAGAEYGELLAKRLAA